MKFRLLVIIIVVILAALVGGFLTWWNLVLKPAGGDKVISIEIPNNTSYRRIGSILEEKGVIRSKIAFDFYVLMTGQYGKLKAGQYLLNTDDSLIDTVSILAGGKVITYRLTIPEGLSINEVDEYLTDKYSIFGFKIGQFQDAISSINIPSDILTTFPQAKNNLEGFLFGDTFYLTGKVTEIDLSQKMIDNFSLKVLPNFNRSVPMPLENKYQALILASIVEKEAVNSKDRSIVAGVFLRRLENNQMLQSDVTVEYGLGKNDKEPLTVSDLSSDNPYNTYHFQGLPPAPIANPSLDSINAVFNPTKTDYNYFISDKNGQMHYAVTYEEQLQNQAQYLDD